LRHCRNHRRAKNVPSGPDALVLEQVNKPARNRLVRKGAPDLDLIDGNDAVDWLERGLAAAAQRTITPPGANKTDRHVGNVSTAADRD
jgi:hypothetical protein